MASTGGMEIAPVASVNAIEQLAPMSPAPLVAPVDHRAAALNIAQHATAYIPGPLPYCTSRPWESHRR